MEGVSESKNSGFMNRITIFSAPKPFSDSHINIIQRNAIRSWQALGSQVEVILIGDEPGLSETAIDIGVRHIPDVEKNQLGTPLAHSIFNQARESTENEILVYSNADIILFPECLPVIQSIYQQKKEFLLAGRRWELDITSELDFKGNWTAELDNLRSREGKLQVPAAMDYFVFPRHLFREIPPFAIGRAGWDNWMIYHAKQQPWPVIDVTQTVIAIHQNHDYSHLPDGKPHYDLEESHQNVDLSGGMKTVYDLLDVNLVYRGGKIRKKSFSIPRCLRKLERLVIPGTKKGWRWYLTRILRKWIGRLS